MKKSIYHLIVKFITTIFGLNSPNRFSMFFKSQMEYKEAVNTKSGPLWLDISNKLNFYRFRTFYTKEPDTIKWIDSFDDNAILFDVGANVGLYSLYAAKMGCKQIVSLEPESQNYAVLNKNIFLNDLSGSIQALNLGVGSENSLQKLYLSTFQAGSAINNMGAPIDADKEEFEEVFTQSIMSYTLDRLVEITQIVPTHLKVDVDGLELEVVKGASNLLSNPKLKEILIELNENQVGDQEVIAIIKANGFEIRQKETSPIVSTKFQHFYNFLFVRGV